MITDLPSTTPCSKCGRPTAGIELTPGAISSVCRPGEGCAAKPDERKKEVKRAAPRPIKKHAK